MTPLMHVRVRDLFIDAGLTAGLKVQTRYWKDTGVKTDSFIIFRSAGGAPIRNQLGSEYMVQVDVIGAKNADEAAENISSDIITYVQENPMPNNCIGHIENIGGFPRPMLSAEGRIVYSMQFAVLYGE